LAPVAWKKWLIKKILEEFFPHFAGLNVCLAFSVREKREGQQVFIDRIRRLGMSESKPSYEYFICK